MSKSTKKKKHNLEERLISGDYSVFKEMGIPLEVVRMLEQADGKDMTWERYQEVTRLEDG